MMIIQWLIAACFLSTTILSAPLEPGQPGGPWTEEEINIVRDKVGTYMTI